ncbi:unnamed protein product [Didymodactylos carnosus]|uniref:Uncharacterized protein n=1 Tax=Didymodactylos carnosus TaxID=1234261 RepID=A0A815RST6_9BILA|nr:unnamed protein product [Didymodactylos carnosus]CAF1481349.1 unnamed protein product [Didymodactylos carnosus]CAF4071797.1 unnamed protein product [Didymodactylos carnosus]CAF4346339.1 unnamed protein product [Didymodactylos carnosus]
MAGAPECQYKVSYRKHFLQQRQNQSVIPNSNPWFPSTAKMCSTTIEATTSVQNNTVLMKKSPITSSARQFNEQQTDPTASLADIIQKAIKDSQAIILNKMNELELKCVIGSNEQLNMKK